MDLTGLGLTTDANGNVGIDTSTSGVNGLLGAVLGKEVNTGTTSNQAVHNTTNQATTGTTAQTSTNNQTTSGTNSTTGNQATTGTVGNVSTGKTTTDQTTQNSADLAALQSVFAKQSAGITPEMLAAIFQQGAKAAPNLVVGTSNALGARGVGNSPMAQALNQLNMDLTAKAADMNRQMLTDSGNTAAQIAELTKKTSTTGTQANSGSSTQTQNLNTATTSDQVTNQILNAIGSQNTATSQNTTGVQDQTTQAAESKRQTSTINTSVVKSLAGMAAAGVGINELFKIATGKGFVGTISDLAKKLAGSGVSKIVTDGVNLSGIFDNAGNLVASAPDLASWGAGTIGSGLEGMTGDIGSYIPAAISDGSTGFTDIIGSIFGSGWADGGSVSDADFLPVEQIIKPEKKLPKNEDADMEALLSGALGVGGAAAAAKTASRNPAAPVGTAQRDTSNSGDGSVGGVGATSTGNIGTSAGGTGVSNSVAGMIGAVASAITGIPGLSTAAQGLNAMANNQAAMANAEEADAGMNAAAQAAAEAGFGPAGTMGDSGLGIGGISVGDSGLGVSVGSGLGGGIGGGIGSDAGGIGGIGGESAGGEGGDSGGGDFADGGEVEGFNLDGDNDSPSGQAAGLSDDNSVDALHPALLPLLAAAIAMPKMADGGRLIQGPGTGVSDSIPATGPSGQPMRVANGEYIIPADVVEKFGVHAFDKLVNAHHVPASVQKANNG